MANITEQTRLILASLANLRAITPVFQGIWPDYWTWPRDYANKQYHKVWWWSIEKYSSYRADKVYFGNFGQFKDHKCFKGSGWLSNLAEIFCQQIFSLPAAHVPIICPGFFKLAYKNCLVLRNCMLFSLLFLLKLRLISQFYN